MGLRDMGPRDMGPREMGPPGMGRPDRCRTDTSADPHLARRYLVLANGGSISIFRLR